MKYTGIKVTNTGMCPHIPVYQRVRFPWQELKVFHDAESKQFKAVCEWDTSRRRGTMARASRFSWRKRLATLKSAGRGYGEAAAIDPVPCGSTTDQAATSVFGHVFRRCVCTRGPCRRRQVLLSAGRLQPGRRGPCFTTNRIGGFRPWRRVANTDCRQTGAMRHVWSRRILRKRRTRGGRRRRRSAGPNVLMHSSMIATSSPRFEGYRIINGVKLLSGLLVCLTDMTRRN